MTHHPGKPTPTLALSASPTLGGRFASASHSSTDSQPWPSTTGSFMLMSGVEKDSLALLEHDGGAVVGGRSPSGTTLNDLGHPLAGAA